jgi:hypothetical protein
MAASEPTAVVDGSVVRVLVGGRPAGTCRFVGGRLRGYEGQVLGDTEETHQTALSALAERLLVQAREELAAMQREAFDDEGVDVSLIRWMLSLTPLERLRTLDAHNRFISLGRAALRSQGLLVPEGVE